VLRRSRLPLPSRSSDITEPSTLTDSPWIPEVVARFGHLWVSVTTRFACDGRPGQRRSWVTLACGAGTRSFAFIETHLSHRGPRLSKPKALSCASISAATASDADAPDRSQRIDRQPATCQKSYQQSAHQPGDIILSAGDIISESVGDFVGICTPGSSPRKAPPSHSRLEFRAVLLPLYAHVSRPFGPVSL
jgi:hypothetical protein